MMRFMYAFTWREPPNPDLAGAEQTRVEELIAEGRMEQMFLARDRSRGWLVMTADTQQEAQAAVETLPFSPIMQLEATPLLERYP